MANPALNINIKASDADAHKALSRLQGDVRKLGGEVDETRKSTTSLSDSLGSYVGPAVYAAGLYKATQAASDLQQAVGSTESVFGSASGAIDTFADNSAEAIGLSERAFREATAPLGSILQSMGQTQEQAAETSVTIAQLGADFAAAFGGTTQDAIDAVSAAFRGEFDPLEKYGVKLSAAKIESKALAMNLADTKAELDDSAKSQAALAIIMEDSANVQGQWNRELGSAASETQIAKAKYEDAAASLGENLLPIMTQAASAAGTLADVFGALPGPVQTALIALGGVVLVGPKVAAGLSMVQAATVKTAAAASTMATNLVVPTKAVEGLGTTSATAATGTSKLGTAMAAVGWAGAIAGAAAYGNSLNEVTVNAEEALGATEEQLVEADRVMNATGDAGEAYRKMGEQSIEALYAVRDALGENYDAESALGQAISDAEAAQGRKNERTREYKGAVDEATGATTDLGDADDTTADKITDNNSAYQSRADLLKTINDEQQEAIDRAFGAAGAADDYERSVNDTAKAADELLWLRSSGQATAEELAEAERKLDDAIRNQAQAADDAWRTQAELEGAHYDAATSAAVQKRELEKASVAVGEMTDDTAGLIDELEETEVERQIKIDRSEILKAIEAINIMNERLGYTRPTESGTTRPGQDPALGQVTRPRPTESVTIGPGRDPALSRGASVVGGNGIYIENMTVGGIKGVADLEMALAARDHSTSQDVMIGG